LVWRRERIDENPLVRQTAKQFGTPQAPPQGVKTRDAIAS
jgi:hypothetical protein